jgi:hypothetical protein
MNLPRAPPGRCPAHVVGLDQQSTSPRSSSGGRGRPRSTNARQSAHRKPYVILETEGPGHRRGPPSITSRGKRASGWAGLPCYSTCIAIHPVRSRGMIPGGKKLHRIRLSDVRDPQTAAPPFSSSADHAQRISADPVAAEENGFAPLRDPDPPRTLAPLLSFKTDRSTSC